MTSARNSRRRALVAAVLLLLGCSRDVELELPGPPALSRMEPGVRRTYERLRAKLDLSAQSDEERAQALAALGHWYLIYSEPKIALDAYDAAAHLDPADFRYHYFAGVASARQGRPSVAQRHFERALGLAPEHAPLRVYLGEALLDQGKVALARRQVLDAVDDPVAEPRARVLLGRLALQTGATADAVAQLEKARSLAPQSRQVRFLLGTAYQRAGRTEEARSLLGETTAGVARVADLPDDPLLQDEIGQVRSDSKSFARRAERRAASGRYREAADEYRRALEAAGGGDSTVRTNLIEVLLRAGSLGEARREVELMQAADPDNAMTSYSRGALAQAEGRLGAARGHYSAAVQADPSLLAARDALAELLFREARWEEALLHYRWLVEHQPANASFRHREALTLLLLGREAEARSRLDRPGVAAGDARLAYLLARTLALPDDGGAESRDRGRWILVQALSGRLRLLESETLAMFHDAQGETEAAIFWQEVAVARARRIGRADLIERTESRLQRYRSGQGRGPAALAGEHDEAPVLPPGTVVGRRR